MRPSWTDPFRSYLGGSIHHTATARYNSAVRWYRTLINLGFPATPEITRLARFIRYGVLNVSEASAVFYGRLSDRLTARYSWMLYVIEYKFLPEDWFYFKFIDWSWLNTEKVKNTTLFP